MNHPSWIIHRDSIYEISQHLQGRKDTPDWWFSGDGVSVWGPIVSLHKEHCLVHHYHHHPHHITITIIFKITIIIIITVITVIIIISLLITILIIFCIHGGCPHTMILYVKINQVPPLYMTLGDYNHKDSTVNCKLTQGLPQSGGPWIGNRLHLKRWEKTPIQFCHHHHYHHHHLITYNCSSQFL